MRFLRNRAVLAGMLLLCLPQGASAGMFGESGLFTVCVTNYHIGYGTCGYINEKGEWAISPRFEAANPFMADGTAWVEESSNEVQKARLGRINKHAEWVEFVEPTYYWIDSVGKEAVVAHYGNSFGLITTQGKQLPQEFPYIGEFSEHGLAPATRYAPYGYINKQGEWVIKPIFSKARPFNSQGRACVELNGRSGYIDVHGNWLKEFTPDEWESLCTGGYTKSHTTQREAANTLPVAKRLESGDGCGYVNSQGEWVIKPIFDYARNFFQSLACVQYGAKWGCITPDGAWAIPPIFSGILDFSDDGLAAAQASSGLWGFIDKQGEWVVKPAFEYVFPFTDDGLSIAQEPNNSGFINSSGEWVIPPVFRDVSSFDAAGLAVAKSNGKYGYIDMHGKWVLLPLFDGADGFAENGLAAVKQGERWGYINLEGKWIQAPLESKAGRFATNGLAWTSYDGKNYGYISYPKRPTSWAIAPDFRDTGDFAANGLAFAKRDALYGYINAQGKWTIEPQFLRAEAFASNGLAAAKTDIVREHSDWGYIDSHGEWVIPPRYTNAGMFNRQGLAQVSVGHPTYFLYFIIDATGTQRVPFGFSQEDIPLGVHWKYAENGDRTLFDSTGKVILLVEHRCEADIVTNAAGKIIWPLDGIVPECQDE